MARVRFPYATSLGAVTRYRVPCAHAQTATRHPSSVFRNATANIAPDCVTFVPCKQRGRCC